MLALVVVMAKATRVLLVAALRLTPSCARRYALPPG
jgi:hypothetical protein